MTRVADECRTQKHHPEWSNTYNVVFVKWTTHKTGTLSEKDVVMARFCDEAAKANGEIEVENKEVETGGNAEGEVGGMENLAAAAAKDGCEPCASGGIRT